MGESAVLFHSYSFAAPSSRNQSHEENPIHALSQSVSFGRFMTENLEWGRWSSFSHKKYVDEAEKFSQPGSVAQKKAFFEAHYKKIAEAKKAKASNDEASADNKQDEEPESVAVLLNTLETLTKDEVKEEESDETDCDEELVLSIEKDEELERQSVLQAVHEVPDEMEEKESYIEDEKLLKKSCSVKRRSSEALETPDKALKLFVSEKKSERLITHCPVKSNEKPVRQRFSFLSCLMGNTKTSQDQNLTRKKRKTDKKPNKPFLCFFFNPKMVGETEAPTKTQRRSNL